MQDWARQIAAGSTRALARVATGVENRDPQFLAVLRELAPQAGHAVVVGITGPPGAGKSTLVDALARALRQAGHTVGIIAVDPSSRASGGAILGDRIRMQDHHADPGIFIRSMATRGSVGGLARSTGDLAVLLDAAGKDYVLIETVGVGQDEIEIAGLAQVTVVVLVPGMGDDVQAIKAGLMEIADIYVINKADQPGADRVEREVGGMLSLGHRPNGWQPPIVRTVATEGSGIPELLAAIQRYREAYPPALVPCPTVLRYTIDHLGIAVKSLDEALGFYEGSLGMAVSRRESIASDKVQVAVLPTGRPSSEGPRIELLEPKERDSVVGQFLEERGEGLQHMAIRVPDLDAIVTRLRDAGARLIDPPGTDGGEPRYVFVDPASAGGVLVQLIQESET